MRNWQYGLAVWALLGASAAQATTKTTSVAPPDGLGCAFNIQLNEAGAYRLDFGALRAAGASEQPPVAVEPFASKKLHLTWRGQTTPIQVEDGGDGIFGPGDYFEWLGEAVRGEKSYFDELTRTNVYRLDACGQAPAGARVARQAPFPTGNAAPKGPSAPLRIEEHLEQDQLLLRFSEGTATEENWYWAKVTQVDEAPFTLPINLRLYEANAGPLALKLNLRGWSYRSGGRHGLPDHAVEILFNGHSLGVFHSDQQAALEISLPEVPANLVQGALNQLAIRVVPRQAPDGTSIVDAMVLNWVEISFPRRQLIDGQQNLYVEPANASADASANASANTPRLVTLRTADATTRNLVVLDEDGRRWEGAAVASDKVDETVTRHRLVVPATSRRLTVVPGEFWRQPVAVEVDRPSNWLASAPQTDYLMIVHPTLREATLRLAEYHRKKGLTVSVVDVRDIFDEVNFGLRHPRALRDFISHAWHEWPEPKVRWVLLVGDASWDPRENQANDANYADWTYQPGETNVFIKNGMIPYADAGAKNRDLIPAWPEQTFQGHAASDNFFVAIEGDDIKPDLAIGRFPVVSPAEVTAIVEKIERYGQSGDSEWQKNAVFITNEEEAFKRMSDRVAEDLAGRMEIQKVYPAATEASNEQNTANLRKAFDDGTLLVHFLGHGGRYIWRTGPPDYRKNHDLFTLEDLDKLEPNDRLPMILSMTCYSGPFDHPTADSIGEKFLRLEKRGAIAVLAASWRNSPTEEFSKALIEALLRPGVTIGEAIREAKLRPDSSKDCIEQYNLFGDPALKLAIPATVTAASGQPSEPAPAHEKTPSH